MAEELRSKSKKASATKAAALSEAAMQQAIEKAVNIRLKDEMAHIGVSMFQSTCCNKLKKKSEFYVNTDPEVMRPVTCVCKECATKIALKVDKDGNPGVPDRLSVAQALERLDKPYFESVYLDSMKECAKDETGKKSNRTNVWSAYIKNIAMPQYTGLRWHHGEMPTTNELKYNEERADKTEEVLTQEQEQFLQNRADVIKLLGYDPYARERAEDQPFLYAQSVLMLDSAEEGNQDAIKISSIIEIVKSFLHIEKLNDVLTELTKSPTTIESKAGTIKNIEQIKKDMVSSIQKLAQESCISLKNSKNQSKGENTWTGRMRKMKDLDLRERENNIFDAMTAFGIAQVAEISNAAMIKQIALDENDYVDMLAQQKERLFKLQQTCAEAEEKARILLRENEDLKQLIIEKGFEEWLN